MVMKIFVMTVMADSHKTACGDDTHKVGVSIAISIVISGALPMKRTGTLVVEAVGDIVDPSCRSACVMKIMCVPTSGATAAAD